MIIFFLNIFSDQDLLSAAAWYQEGLSEDICVEYLNHLDKPIGSFIIRRNYRRLDYPYTLSIKTTQTSIEHFFIEQISDKHAYQIQVCFNNHFFFFL